MLNEQVAGLLQNNAGNPAIVSRIAEENGLSQTEIAQALRIPEGAAARYMPEQSSMAAPAVVSTRTLANPAGMASPPPATGPAPTVAPVAASPMGQMADAMQSPAIGGTMGGTGVGPAGLGTAGMTKPAKLPAGMRPQGLGAMNQGFAGSRPMRQPLPGAAPGRRPGGSPALPRGPGAEGEQAFVNAFNKLRGNAQ